METQSSKYILNKDDIGLFSDLFDTMGNKLFIGDIVLGKQYVRINKYKAKMGEPLVGLVLNKGIIIMGNGLLPQQSLIVDPMIDKTNQDIFYKYFKIGTCLDNDMDYAVEIVASICSILNIDPTYNLDKLSNIFGKLKDVYIKSEEEEE